MESVSKAEAAFLIITFLFMVGSMTGWVIELLFRRFISKNNPSRKWINPGFLAGPCLPLYGFGLTVLFIMSIFPYVGAENVTDGTAHVAWAILIMGIMMTLIELIAGLIFIKGLKIKLWDYSNEFMNLAGIICPKFSVIWTVLAAVYYFFIQKYVVMLVRWFADNIAFTFVVGMFYGILAIDLVYSFNIVGKVRKFAVENDIVVKYEMLKEEIRRDTDSFRRRGRFLLALRPEGKLAEKMQESLDSIAFMKTVRKKDKK